MIMNVANADSKNWTVIDLDTRLELCRVVEADDDEGRYIVSAPSGEQTIHYGRIMLVKRATTCGRVNFLRR